jgi:hypothetical protein
MLCKVALAVDLEVEKRRIHMVPVVVHLRRHMVVRADERLRRLLEEEVVVERRPVGQPVGKHLDMEVMEARHLLMELLEVVGHLDGQDLVLVLDHVRPIHTLLKLDLRNPVDLMLLHCHNNSNNNRLALPILILLLRLILPPRLLLDILLLHHITHLHPLFLLPLPLVVLLHLVLLRLMAHRHLMELQRPTELPLRHLQLFKPHLQQTRYHGIGQWISGISSLKSDHLLNPQQRTQDIIKEEHTMDVDSAFKII